MKKTFENIVAIASKYLQNPADPVLGRQLGEWSGEWSSVIEKLKPVPPRKGVPTGVILDRPFQIPRLRKKHPKALMALFVPPDYSPDQHRGLIIHLHGGGKFSSPETPSKMWREQIQGFQDLFMESGFIVCMPVAPGLDSFACWNHPCVDEYLADLIEELESHYAIDPHRICLSGHSMGGMGAMHLVQRMPDRFASVLALAGSWDLAVWPVVEGTDFWFAQGANDAVFQRRRHGTDVAFGRVAHRRLEELGIPHHFREYPGGHEISEARRVLLEWLQHIRGVRRNPFHPCVTAVSPRGSSCFQDWRRFPVSPAGREPAEKFAALAPSPHLRWLSVGDPGGDTICFDQAVTTPCSDWAEEDWNQFDVLLKRKQVRAAMAEAWLRDGRTVEVAAKNTDCATLWLHPEMVDLDRLRVFVHGCLKFDGTLRPNLKDALDSYLRRRDWGLIYPACLRLEADQQWKTNDQINQSRSK